ncbi:maleate cis-trans isomerase family protein [Paraburkholderia phenoliruptrix]|uniref:Asp/Glu/hydantoin racemase n=2 Tax=Paraburkholderia phenoliruptrix TaxID=252970 RepID=K0E3G4_9BURK|nr:Asp/Glu/hydantoin racemase [Paraburkholderia phenoliruptrix]AFT90354.1 Asp/Glu/hydantoin racemase [Paraburkholderia phenoliruptrix BR3459a]CAB4051775.1 Maleate isomerase [Paraburkholderia phenoliruptrix]
MHTQANEPQARQHLDLEYQLDQGIGYKAHIGMVVLDCDQTLSYEARAMLTLPGVALYESRIDSGDRGKQPLTADLLREVFNGLDLGIAQINSRRPSDVVALGCTSAAMVIGTGELERRVRNVHPNAAVTDPFKAILAALATLGSSKVGYISPYPDEVAGKMVKQIEDAGYPVPVQATFHRGSFVKEDAPYVSPESIASGVSRLVGIADVDTVVISCTQMRAASVIDDLERRTGKAIITSNQALCWHALRLAGYTDPVGGWGRLFMKS